MHSSQLDHEESCIECMVLWSVLFVAKESGLERPRDPIRAKVAREIDGISDPENAPLPQVNECRKA